jgi:hypothetical protein
LEEALRHDASHQLAAIEAAAFPHLEERGRMQIVQSLRWSMLTTEEQGAQIDTNWAMLRSGRGLPVLH